MEIPDYQRIYSFASIPPERAAWNWSQDGPRQAACPSPQKSLEEGVRIVHNRFLCRSVWHSRPQNNRLQGGSQQDPQDV